MKKAEPLITVGELLNHLQGYSEDTKVSFSGLDFKRVKQRGPDVIQIEFNQQVYRDTQGEVVVENH